MPLLYRVTTISILLAIAMIGAAREALARPVQPEDLFRLSFVSGAQISHDGKWVAFVVKKADGAKNTYHSNIWLAETTTSRLMQLTRGDSDQGPQWSPDDRWIAFSSGRLEKSQIFRISLAGGEAEKLTNMPTGADTPLWSNDGSRIAFQAASKNPKRKTEVDWHAAGFEPSEEQRTSDVRVVDVLHFEDNGAGETWMLHQHIWVMRADGSQPKQLTSGTQWAENAVAWSPDDREIYFNSYRAFDPYLFRTDIYAIPSDGGEMRKIALSHKLNVQPTFAKGGKRLWYYAVSAPDPAAYPALVRAALDGSGEDVIVPENSIAFGDAVLTDAKEAGAGCGPLFGPAERWFVADVSVPGGTAIEKFDAASGKMQSLVSRGDEILDCSLSDDGSRLAFTSSDATHPAEVFITDLPSGATRQLSFFNKPYVDSADLSTPERFTVKDSSGFTVTAWIMRPPHAIAGRRYPTLLEIHGGPETLFGNSFFHEMQYFASLGYNVVFSDPRGSVGFGYPFEAALQHRWGDAMFDDINAVMNEVVKRPDVDSSRLGVLGGSYGGYATLWIIGHTQRFKAAVAERVASNLTSEVLASDFSSASDDRFFYGNPWDHAQAYWNASPLKYVKNVFTPVLIIHSDNDTRTPIDQSLQMYSALKILGRTTRLVQFPRENHDLNRTGEPLHRVERLHLIADWLNAYLRP